MSKPWRTLPAQAPFIDHETLPVFEHLSFPDALSAAHDVLGVEPYLPELAYRAAYARGRIRPGDLETTLDEIPHGDALVAAGLTRRELCRLMMLHDVSPLEEYELEREIHEHDFFDRPVEGAALDALDASVSFLRRLDEEEVRRRVIAEEGELLVVERLGPIGARLRLSPVALVLRAMWSRISELCESRRDRASLFRIAQLAGFDLVQLESFDRDEAGRIVGAMSAFDSVMRRSIWHEAYERRDRHQLLHAVAAVAQEQRERAERPLAEVQLGFCIDDREESLRRHVEELGHDVETWGIVVAGLGRGGVDTVAPIFQRAGWTSFAPLVVLLGHGSDCDACGGRDATNVRVLAHLLNGAELRARLAEHGVYVPDQTYFVGGVHDTSHERIALFDDDVPESHCGLLQRVVGLMDQARAHNAHERVRRFREVPLQISPARALAWVEGRDESVEHCANAVCLVGRRWLQRGLFLDRRAFLVSYDPTLDESGERLAKLLADVVPMGAGISLEQYFASVNPNGHADVHEPVRLLTIVEASVQRLRRIEAHEPRLARLIENRWIQLVAMDPDDGSLCELTNTGWHEFRANPEAVRVVETSQDAYGMTRSNIPPVRVRAATGGYTPV